MNSDDYKGSKVKETAIKYSQKKQGTYTIEDYYNMPEDQRIELIDGVIYDMASPSIEHQIISGHIYNKLSNHIFTNKGNCKQFISPIAVKLSEDNNTMVEPDVIVVCNKDYITSNCINGAPDFILEVTSKSSKIRDTIVKLNKYKVSGVKEYWIIDYQENLVHIYNFARDTYVKKTFQESYIITVLNPPCTIDFKEIHNEIIDTYK